MIIIKHQEGKIMVEVFSRSDLGATLRSDLNKTRESV